jgi:hypothetical protein
MATSGTATIAAGESSVTVTISNVSFDQVTDGTGLQKITRSYIVNYNFERNVGNVQIYNKTATSFTLSISNIDLANETSFVWKLELI